MGDVEEIIAEPDEGPGFIESTLFQIHKIITSNGWLILAGSIGGWYLWKNYIATKLEGNRSSEPQSAAEISAFQAKEEARLRAVQKLQEKYAKDSAETAEKQRLLAEEKRKARLAELEKLDAKGGKILGSEPGSSKSQSSFRPEYNPLMGDTSSRVCVRRPGGGAGGGG